MNRPDKPLSILVIDDEPNHAEAMSEILSGAGHEVTLATSGENGLKTLSARRFDIVLTDLVMAPVSGLDVLAEAKTRYPDCEVILVSGHGSVEQAVEAIKQGAANYLTKPLRVAELREKVADLALQIRNRRRGDVRTTAATAAAAVAADEFPEFIGRSSAIQKVLETIRRVAPAPVPVLITGSNGTGKELVARALHRLSARRNKPFVALNCGAMPESTIESELFGHVKGAFTGAERNREGRFEFANEGTLFLDEVGEMSLSMQVKLLRVLEGGEVVPVGANRGRQVDVRIIAATNRRLEDEIARGNFREDLFYRLRVIHIHMPELRERREDIPLLVEHFISLANAKMGKKVTEITDDAMQRLVNCDWPGNVRQLRNAVDNMVVMAAGAKLEVQDIPSELRGDSLPGTSLVALSDLDGLSLSKVEEYLIRQYLERYDGNRARVAAALGISERTLYRKLREYELS